MKKMVKDKAGQFYLIAAIVIITMLAGIFTIANYSRSKSTSLVYELKEELITESGRVLDERVGSPQGYQWDSFTRDFSMHAGKDVDIYYLIISNPGMYIDFYTYDDSYNYYGPLPSNILSDNIVSVEVDGNDYEFKMREGENFYFIITQKIGDDVYVATN